MPRKGWVLRRKIPGDPVYRKRPGAEVYLQHDVRRQARRPRRSIFYNAMDQVAKKTNDDAFKLFKKASRTASRCWK